MINKEDDKDENINSIGGGKLSPMADRLLET